MRTLEYSIMKDVISDLEHIIGRNCYSKTIVDKATGKAGKKYRYPVQYNQGKKTIKCRGKANINELTAADEVDTMRYKFGANLLFVGDAIVEILEYLEERYELDFARLESDGEWLDFF